MMAPHPEPRKAPLGLALAGSTACLLLAVLVAFVWPGALRLSGPLVCPSGYHRSEGYRLVAREGDEATLSPPALRCYGRDDQVLAEHVPAKLAVPVVAMWIGGAGVVVIGLPLHALRRRRRESLRLV